MGKTYISINNEKEKNKKKIINLFYKKVKGKSSQTLKANQNHDGKDGHWLETQMGIKHNGKNDPDIYGFEMKNHTTSKTTFGDWSPDFSIFKRGGLIDRDLFLRTFGAPNPNKGGRYSWSGRPCPKINVFNFFGQKLEIDSNNNILVIYSFTMDQRDNKEEIVPKEFQKSRYIIASWSSEMMRKRVESKFNKFGWFKCIKNNNGIYSSIVFGSPINFESWIGGVKNGLIFFDSGMYQGNIRPYSQWRADNKYWDSLVIETF